MKPYVEIVALPGLMRKKMIRTLGDPALLQPTKLIEVFNKKLHDLSKRMFDIMYQNNGVGLAANQIGISKSMFVYDDQKGHSGTICNPELYNPSSWTNSLNEGCLSIPGLYRPVDRFKYIDVLGVNLNGEEIHVRNAEGVLAQIFQHECEHLRGKLFISNLPQETQAAIVLGHQVMN